MTIKLLSTWGPYQAGTVLSLDTATENGLVAAGQATTTLTGGTSAQGKGGVTAASQQTLVAKAILTRFGIVGAGQSNERGQMYDAGGIIGPYFWGNSSSGYTDPIAPALLRAGGPLIPMAERLMARGAQIKLANCGLGSISLVRHMVGQTSNRGSAGQGANSNSFYRARASSGGGDPGDYGSITINSGRVFQCSAGGRGRWAYYSSATPLTISGAGTYTQLDYYKEETTAGVSGSSDPNWASAVSIGDTVADGGITWKLVATSSTGYPSNTGILNPGNLGFDPMGLIARIVTAAGTLTGVDQTWVHWANGQADTWTQNPSIDNTYMGWYRSAYKSLLNQLLNSGLKVAAGLSVPSPASGPIVWSLLQQAKNLAIQDVGSANVIQGCDGLALFGMNPPLYPEGGVAANGYVHLTPSGQDQYGAGWAQAFIDAGIV